MTELKSRWDGGCAATGHRPSEVDVAVLAGICFWGVEDILRDVPGVIDTRSATQTVTLRTRLTGPHPAAGQGHAEAVRVTFDPSVLSFEALL